MHFFRIHSLGAYIAIPMIYNSCISEKSFDQALEDRKKYLEEKQKRDDKIAEFEAKIKEIVVF